LVAGRGRLASESGATKDTSGPAAVRGRRAVASWDPPKPAALTKPFGNRRPVTVHSSQGLTADRVLIDASTRSRTTTKDVFYVAISRAQHEARVYTDDRARLPIAVEREHRKEARWTSTEGEQARAGHAAPGP